jgi:hypothetical protein
MADYTVPSTPSTGNPDLATGTVTTFELPNFVGELFHLIPAQTPFLSMMGGLTGGKSVMTKEFTWQVTDNEEASETAQGLEGADPTDKSIIRQEVKNVVEIHHESVNVSYTKQAAVEQLGAGGAGTGAQYSIASAPILGDQPVRGEIPLQLALKINKVARDVEKSFLIGVYDYPVDNATPRTTRGILTAITIHDQTFATSIKSSLDLLLTGMYEDETKVAPLVNPVIFVNGGTKVTLSTEYSNNLGLADRSRTVGGVNVETLITDFGTFGIVLDRYMPTDELLLADMSVVAPCFLPIPGKGHFFTEPLAKTGAYDRVQLYGELGLEYGPEQFHGKISTIT